MLVNINMQRPIWATALIAVMLISSQDVMLAFQDSSPQPVPLLQADPTDPVEKARRDATGRAFNIFGVGTGPGVRTLAQANPNAPAMVTTVDLVLRPELPLDTKTQAIVTGTVEHVRPFLSENQAALYTEYSVRVSEIFRLNAGSTSVGATLRAAGAGSTAQLPNGRVLRHEVHGYGKRIEAGHRYVFFLDRYLQDGQCFQIRKVWEINAGQALASAQDDLVHVQKGESQYNGMDEQQFVVMLRKLVSSEPYQAAEPRP